jgi:hypothetical protein
MPFASARPRSSESFSSSRPAGQGFRRAHLHCLALLHRLDGVLLGDVDELVTQHAGQFGFILDQRQRAAGDVDVATGRGEGIDAVGVEDDEVPRQRGTRAGRGERAAHQRHIAVDGGILDHTVARANPLADRGAELLFFGIGELDVANLVGLLDRAANLAKRAQLVATARRQRRAEPQSRRQNTCRCAHHDGLTS